MSARNTHEAKRARRAHRTLAKGRLPRWVNLVEWVQMRSSLSAGVARKVLLSGALQVDSHKVGYKVQPNGVKTLDVLLPADLRDRIQVVTPEALRDG